MEGAIFALLLAAALLIVLVLVAKGQRAAEQLRQEAERVKNAEITYQKSLDALTQNPLDRSLRRRTLQLGRTAADLRRGDKGVTLYDEMALMNDLNAATGGAVATLRTASQS